MNTTVIDLWGGPGCGKSVLAAQYACGWLVPQKHSSSDKSSDE